jgi:hypothetical protein
VGTQFVHLRDACIVSDHDQTEPQMLTEEVDRGRSAVRRYGARDHNLGTDAA